MRIIAPEDIEILPPEEPRINLEGIQEKEFNSKPELKDLMPRDEIERAIQNIKEKIEQEEEVREEIVLMRRVIKKRVSE